MIAKFLDKAMRKGQVRVPGKSICAIIANPRNFGAILGQSRTRPPRFFITQLIGFLYHTQIQKELMNYVNDYKLRHCGHVLWWDRLTCKNKLTCLCLFKLRA